MRTTCSTPSCLMPGEGGRGQFNSTWAATAMPGGRAPLPRWRPQTDDKKRNDDLTKRWKIHQDEIGHIPLHQQALNWGAKGHELRAVARQRYALEVRGGETPDPQPPCPTRKTAIPPRPPARVEQSDSSTASAPRRWRWGAALIAFVCSFCAAFAPCAPHNPSI